MERDGRVPPTPMVMPVTTPVLSAVRATAGEIWFNTEAGVLRFRADRRPPETTLLAGSASVLTGDPFGIEVAARERYGPLTTDGFAYSYRVNGGPWSRFGPPPTSFATAALPTGANTIEVRARDEGLDVDPTPARVSFNVIPLPLQLRWWFGPLVGGILLALALAAGGLAYRGYRRR